MMGRPVRSLRGHLLALLVPVAAAAVLGSMFAVYLIVRSVSAESLDEGLAAAATIYAEQLRARPDTVPQELPARAQRMLLATPDDRIFFTLEDADGRLLAGTPRLADDLPWGNLVAPAFFDLSHSGFWLRGISFVFAADGRPRHLILATTAHKRELLLDEIMFSMVIPQGALFLLAIVLVWAGVRQGLAPLAALRAEIGRRSHRDLRPLDASAAPEELHPVIDEINALFGRLGLSIESQRHFIADAAHQLRTPIAGLLAQLESAGATGNPALLLTARRLSRLVAQLLALSRAEPGVEPAMTGFDLAALIRTEANAWLPQAIRHDVELSFELGEACLHGSAHAFREMLANLIDNAIRYGRPGGNVAIHCLVEAGGVVLRVDDDGPGIPEAERERVFERFYRGMDARAEGCGLGLPIVRALARQHGAEVHLGTSPDLGGLRVEIRVPRKAIPE